MRSRHRRNRAPANENLREPAKYGNWLVVVDRKFRKFFKIDLRRKVRWHDRKKDRFGELLVLLDKKFWG